MTGPERFSALEALLDEAVRNGTTPGAQLSLRWREGGAWRAWDHCAGALEYGEGAPPVTPGTRYDLASLTKVFVAATAWSLHEAGALPREAALADVLPEARGTYAGGLSVEALATHRGELPAFLPYYRAVDPRDTASESARRAVLDAVLATGREPGGVEERYSDVGYILLGEAVAHAAAAPLPAAVSRVLAGDPAFGDEALGIAYRGVAPAPDDESVAPTEVCAWRGRLVRGQVHDENAFALGGVAGHAGLFGNAAAVAEFGRRELSALLGERGAGRLASLRAMLAPRPGGTHRFGWDSPAAQNSSAGRLASPRAFGHLGFTGTSIWCDPAREACVVLLTNRVHPTRENTRIRALRPAVHDAAFALLGG